MVAANDSKGKKSTIVYSVVAVLLFGILFVTTFWSREKQQESIDVPIVMMGDSILGDVRGETSIASRLSGLLGKSVYNGALGGTCMGRLDREMRLANTKDCLSMQAFSQSIVTGDFGVQQTVRSRENATEYFEETINDLEKIAYESVEILLIGHGINDYHGGSPIYNEDDPYDPYSFTGALRSTIAMLQEQYPDLRIILITPTYSWYPNYGDQEITCEKYNLGGGILEEYVKAEIEVAQSMGVEVIDIYHDFYSHEQWNDWQLYTRDGVHPTDLGCEMIAEKIYNYLSDTEEN